MISHKLYQVQFLADIPTPSDSDLCIACEERLLTIPPHTATPISWEKYHMIREVCGYAETYSCGECWEEVYMNWQK